MQTLLFSLQIYKNLAEDVDINGNSSTDENSQQMALLMKSKSSFYQALDRLGSDRHEVGLVGVRLGKRWGYTMR